MLCSHGKFMLATIRYISTIPNGMLSRRCSSKLYGFMDLYSTYPDIQQTPHNALISKVKSTSYPHTPTCSSTLPVCIPSLHTGVPTQWSGDLVAGSMTRESSFNLHRECITLGQRDPGSVQGRNSRR